MVEVLQFGLSENRGGIETYLRKIWRYIDKTQYHFSFIDMTGEGRFPCFYDELYATGCSFFKVTPRSVSVRKNREDIRRLFSENHFDIFHFNVNTLSYVYPVEEALRNGCHVIVHSRNAGTAPNSFITKWLHSINKVRLKRMDITRIAVSNMAGEWLFGDSHFDVYHNGVITDNFKYSKVNRQMIREDLGCLDKLVIANVGAFLPAKNHMFMVNVFEEFKKTHPNACLWFIGDGPLRKDIESVVRNKGLQSCVLFLGVRKDLEKLYAGMDLFWFPSLYEGFGSVILEAECEGVPCLVSDCIPLDALIADNTFSFDINKTTNEWVLKMDEAIKAQKSNREYCYKEIENMGASVKNEITRLEKLYSSRVNM